MNQVLKRREREGSRDSLMDSVIEQQDKLQLTRSQLDSLGGVLMEGGSDTTANTLLTFIHAMISHPEAQMKAQAEIDGVVGEDRSPLWSDYDQLPYVSMIIKETMRWRPISPTAFPHCLTEGNQFLVVLPLCTVFSCLQGCACEELWSVRRVKQS